MKKLYTLFLVICLSLSLICLVACGDKKPVDDNPVDVDWDSKTILSVEIDSESFEKEYDIDDFKVDLLKLHVTYTDGTDRLIGDIFITLILAFVSVVCIAAPAPIIIISYIFFFFLRFL